MRLKILKSPLSSGLKLSVLILVFAIMGASCQKEDDGGYENIPLEFTKCPCEHEVNFIKDVEREEILLFNASKTSFNNMKVLSANGENSQFVCYYPETNGVIFYSTSTTMMGVGHICNFPEEIVDWNILEKGIYISFSAQEFKLCEPKGSIAANTYADFVLTELKRKFK